MTNVSEIPEIWKDVVGYEGKYQVSNKGRVKGLDRILKRKDGTLFRRKGQILSQCKNTYGYPHVSISSKTIVVHILVAKAFIPNPNNYREVNHISGIKTENMVENLEWCTNTYNINHAYSNGLIKPLIGEKSPGSKLKNHNVFLIKKMIKAGIKLKDLVKIYKVSQPTLSEIKSNKIWKHIMI